MDNDNETINVTDSKKTKKCNVCGEEKDLETGFYRSNSSYSSACRPCKNKQRHEWFLRNKEENMKKLNDWNKKYYSIEENKELKKKKNKEWREKNKEYCLLKDKMKQQDIKERRRIDPVFDKEYLERNRVYKYNNKLINKYGISVNEYLEMVEKCGNCCEICGINGELTRYKKLCVDHCHTTGKVRGLLCDKCNTGLGSFNDSINTIIDAARYIERFNGGVEVVDQTTTPSQESLP